MKSVIRKKLLAITFMIAFVLCITACGKYRTYGDLDDDYVISEKSNWEYEYNEDEIFGFEWDNNDDYIPYDAIEEKETISEFNNDNSAEYIGSRSIENLSAFSEGRALVQFWDSAAAGPQGSERVALIDAQGKILWKSELSCASTVFDYITGFNGFRDGLACFIFNKGDEKRSYIIIDSDGNVTYTKDCTEDFMILGFGDGLFLTAKHIVNFDTNEWQIGTIDKNGNTVAAYKTYYGLEKSFHNIGSPKVDDYDSCEYLGENIYKMNFYYGGYVVLNMDMQDIISSYDRSADIGYIERFITGFENGAATVLYSEPTELNYFPYFANLYSGCRMETDGTLIPIVSNIWSKYVLPDMPDMWDRFDSEGLLFVPYRGEESIVYIDKEYYAMTGDSASAYENGFTLYTGVYYNIEGEVVIDFPEYRGKHEYACSPFCNGYALMMIEGADGLPYFTIIDKKGNFRFELKAGFYDACLSEDGKYLLALNEESLIVFDVNGNSLMRIDAMRRDVDGNPLSLRNFDISEGVIRFGGSAGSGLYVNVEDGAIIGSTFMIVDDLSITKY